MKMRQVYHLHLPSSRVRTLYADSQLLAKLRKKLTDSSLFPGVFMCFACGSGLMDYSLLLHVVYLKGLDTGTEVESTFELLSCANFRSNVMVMVSFLFCKARPIQWKWRPNRKAGLSCDSCVISEIFIHILSAFLIGKEFSNSWGTHWSNPKYRCQYKQVEDCMWMWWIQHGNLSSQVLIPTASWCLIHSCQILKGSTQTSHGQSQQRRSSAFGVALVVPDICYKDLQRVFRTSQNNVNSTLMTHPTKMCG